MQKCHVVICNYGDGKYGPHNVNKTRTLPSATHQSCFSNYQNEGADYLIIVQDSGQQIKTTVTMVTPVITFLIAGWP